MVDIAVAVTAGLGALAWALWTGLLPMTAWWGAVAAAAALVGLGLTALLLRPDKAAALLDRLVPASEAVRSRVAFLRQLSARQAFSAWALSVVRYGIFVAQFVLIICAFDVEPACWKAAFGVGLVFLAKFLIPSVTLMDLGVREGASIYFLGLLGIPDAVAFNAALVLFAINLVLPSALGVPTLLGLDFGAASASPTEGQGQPEAAEAPAAAPSSPSACEEGTPVQADALSSPSSPPDAAAPRA
jgi:uncharacterized membrane protein YbhN (UPF0104 family)